MTLPPLTIEQWMRQIERRLLVQERRQGEFYDDLDGNGDPIDDGSTTAGMYPPGGAIGDVLYVAQSPARAGEVTVDDLEWVSPQQQRPVAIRFVQSTASASWVIPHTLEFRPNVTVVDSSWRKVYGEVSYPDNQTVQVDFSAAFAGEAYLS